MASKPDQNCELLTPVPGSTWVSMNWCRALSTFRRCTAVRGVLMGRSLKNKKRLEVILGHKSGGIAATNA